MNPQTEASNLNLMAGGFDAPGKYAAVELGEDEVRRLRHLLHEMANVFTGILMTGGLLHQALEGDLRQRYTGEICTGGDRGAVLVREAREVLLAPSERMR